MSNDDVLTWKKRQEREACWAHLFTCIICPIISIIICVKEIISISYIGNYLILFSMSSLVSNTFGVRIITSIIKDKLGDLKERDEKRIKLISSLIEMFLTCMFLLAIGIWVVNPIMSAWIFLWLSCLGFALSIIEIIILGKNIMN